MDAVPATLSQVPIGFTPVSAIQSLRIKPSSMERQDAERPQVAVAALRNK